MELLSHPWPWYVAGPLIAGVLFLMLYFGKSFGVSSTFRQLCSACGAGKKTPYFNFDWKAQRWNLLFVLGAILGGFLANTCMQNLDSIHISAATQHDLHELGFSDLSGLAPKSLFDISQLSSLLFIIVGGFCVGFGTRYAGGCTSGHAISGLSNLQSPSLVAVVGFFLGGLCMTHFIFPFIF